MIMVGPGEKVIDVADLTPDGVLRFQGHKPEHQESPAEGQPRDVFVSYSSRDRVNIGFIRDKFELALETYSDVTRGNGFIIPIKLSLCDIPDGRVSNANLRDFHWLEYWKDDGFQTLVDAIKTHTAAVEFGDGCVHLG
jgi:hypothetical protein